MEKKDREEKQEAAINNKNAPTTKHRGAALGQSSSQLRFDDQDKANQALTNVAENKNTFSIFAYVKNKKDEVEHLLSGEGGVEALVPHWPPSDRIYFVYCSIVYQMNDMEHNKFVLVTMIGDAVSPIARARTSGQRKEFIDYIKAICPYHSEFQPNDPQDLRLGEITVKFK